MIVSARRAAKPAMTSAGALYRGFVDDRFVDVWDALDDRERCLLLEQRHAQPVPAAVAEVLARVAPVLDAQPGLFPAPVVWPAGFREFLDDVAAVRDEDEECE